MRLLPAGGAAAPSAGTEGQTRGAGGELKILQWQGVTHFGLHTATGTKDQLGASLVTESLINFLPDGTMIPTLAEEVPTMENGGLAADLSTRHLQAEAGRALERRSAVHRRRRRLHLAVVRRSSQQRDRIKTYQAISNVEAVDPLHGKGHL